MVRVKLMGGLGNQLFQYAFAKNIKVNHGYEVEIEKTWYEKKKECTERTYVLDRLSCDIPIADPLSGIKCKTVIHENSFETVEIMDDVYYVGYWQDPKYFNSIFDHLRKDFTIKNLSIPDPLREAEKAINNDNSVSIHVRRTDYLNNEIYPVCDIEYYTEAMSYYAKKLEKCEFFVFSDDMLWCKQNLAPLSDSISFISSNDDLIDWYLMSRARHHIIANSTYSWWAAWLGNDNGIVIMPHKWLYSDEHEGLRCEKWIVI